MPAGLYPGWKDKLIAVKDELGKILARSVLRLLMDEQSKSPVLFLERIYTCQNTEELSDLIREGALRKAKALGLPLVASSKDYQDLCHLTPYPNRLKSMGGPVPYEYVDALGGIQNNGEFSIDECYVMNIRP